jgi:hypothetical protein
MGRLKGLQGRQIEIEEGVWEQDFRVRRHSLAICRAVEYRQGWEAQFQIVLVRRPFPISPGGPDGHSLNGKNDLLVPIIFLSGCDFSHRML